MEGIAGHLLFLLLWSKFLTSKTHRYYNSLKSKYLYCYLMSKFLTSRFKKNEITGMKSSSLPITFSQYIPKWN